MSSFRHKGLNEKGMNQSCLYTLGMLQNVQQHFGLRPLSRFRRLFFSFLLRQHAEV